MQLTLTNRIKNVAGITALLLVSIFFFSAQFASAASSSFSYQGAYVNGKDNNTFHTLNSGNVYLQVTSHYGASTATLYRQITWSIDRNYGTVSVNSNKTYKFPQKADTHSSRYYLVANSSYSSHRASGRIRN